MKKSSLFALSIVFGGALLTASITEAAIDTAGAALLKQQVEEEISWHLDMAKQGGEGLIMGGAVEVVPKGNYYEVKLPNLSMTFGKGAKLDIGTIMINATEGQPGEWLTSMALPTPMTFYDETNSPAAEITIGNQRFAGAWWPEKDLYSRFDAQYQNIHIQNTSGQVFSLDIDSIRSILNLTEAADGTWSGPNNFELKGLSIKAPAPDQVAISVASIRADAAYTKMDFSGVKEFKKQIRDLMKSGQEPTPEQQKKLTDSVFDYFSTMADGMKTSMEINDLSVKATGGKDVPVDVKLAKAGIVYDMQGMKQEKGNIVLKTSFSGLNVSGIPADFKDLMPEASNLEININSLPVKGLMSVLESTVKQSIQTEMAVQQASSPEQMAKLQATGGMAENPGVALLTSASKMMSDAGAYLSVENTFFKTPAIDTTLNGKVSANETALMKAVGEMNLSVKGLDELIQLFTQKMQAPNANPQLQGYVGGATMLQMMGQLEPASSGGKSTRTYKFQLTPEGKMTLNGSDIGAMMGQGMAPH